MCNHKQAYRYKCAHRNRQAERLGFPQVHRLALDRKHSLANSCRLCQNAVCIAQISIACRTVVKWQERPDMDSRIRHRCHCPRTALLGPFHKRNRSCFRILKHKRILKVCPYSPRLLAPRLPKQSLRFGNRTERRLCVVIAEARRNTRYGTGSVV